VSDEEGEEGPGGGTRGSMGKLMERKTCQQSTLLKKRGETYDRLLGEKGKKRSDSALSRNCVNCRRTGQDV